MNLNEDEDYYWLESEQENNSGLHKEFEMYVGILRVLKNICFKIFEFVVAAFHYKL